MVEFSAKEATNLYLYGTNTTPFNLEDDGLIRGSRGKNIVKKVDAVNFMATGAGRFAVGSQFELIQKFFDPGFLDPEVPAGTYTKQKLASIFGLSSFFGWDMRQLNFQDSSESTQDYIERVYVWNSMSFQISDSARFVVTPSGDKVIENFGVEPRARDGADDNFDFIGGGLIADFGNAYLEPRIDPSKIGRTVDIEFINRNNLPKITYKLSHYNADESRSAAWDIGNISAGIKLLSGRNTFIQNLFTSGEIKFLDSANRPILYGTLGTDSMSASLVTEDRTPTLFPFKDNGLVFIAGAGADNIQGGNKNDKLNGGKGNDTLDGGAGEEDVAFYNDVVANYNFDISDDGEIVTISHVRGTQTDGTDTLTNVEFGQFSDQRIQLLGNKLNFVSDFVVGTTQDTQVVFELKREGDTSFPVTVFVDGKVTRGNAVFNDFPFTIQAGDNPNLIIGASVSEVFGDVAFDFEIKIQDKNSLTGLILIEDNDASGLLIGDQVDDRGGRTFGDPHLITFDNLAYDFQASGDFILARATDGAEYEVQARFVQISSAVSVTEAMATSVNGTSISLEANGGEGTLLVNGAKTIIADGNSVAVGSGFISRTGLRYDIDHGNGDTTSIDVFSSFINVTPSPSLTRTRGKIEGLLGNANGNPADDFQLTDGTILQTPLSPEILYGDYAASWLVDNNTSLLPGLVEQYAAPSRIVTVDSLPETLRRNAEAAVDAVGITNPIIRDAAILDFALTGNEEFIEAAELTDNNFDPIVGTVAVDPVNDPVIILTSDRLELDEEDATARTAILTVARGSSEGDLTVNYSIEGVGTEPAEADDFVDGIVTGEVVIEDGADLATFEIQIADDLLVESTETFDVSISLEDEQADSFEILVSSLRFSINSTDEDGGTTPNIVNGTPGRDDLTGSDEDDAINAGQGRDLIATGDGEDILIYTSIVDAGDIISDFAVGSDKFDFSQLLDSFGYSGSNPFADGYISITDGRASSLITIDPDGSVGSGRARSFVLVENVAVADLDNPDNFIV